MNLLGVLLSALSLAGAPAGPDAAARARHDHAVIPRAPYAGARARECATRRCRDARHRRRALPRRRVVRPPASRGVTPRPSPGVAGPGGRPPASPGPLTPGGAAPAPTAPPVSAPAPGTPGPAPAPARLLVTEREFRLGLSRPSIAAGSLRLDVVNAGEDPHDLRLERLPDALSLPELGPGLVASHSLSLSPGTWRLYCTLPGHDALGMHANLEVR